ncbi:hypothetical protein GCM10025857_28730 [Alicyclobacillus contaminans]|nr:hypothetical protein GCM10025857_28730 [Alicyclobacillus contaminans]
MLFRLSACLNLCTHWLARSGDSEEMLQLLRMFRSALRQDVAPAEDELPVERGEAETGWLTEMERQTRQQNRNNLTRTAAYLDVYRRNPELHWAFLAHMVSRNGGWNMTDLRGEWFQRLTDDRLVDAFFRFLEQANWLIFSDAYPQLLMYEWSKREGRDLSGYLGRFGVSRFMRVVWRWFWQHRNASVLTRALIVNEQNFWSLASCATRIIEPPCCVRLRTAYSPHWI